MLAEWLELPGAADQLGSWSQTSGLDLVRLGTTATAEEITDTSITQPLVVAATLLAHQELTRQLKNRRLLADTGGQERWGHRPPAGQGDDSGINAETVVAGHSVGEIAAYAIAGVISADDAVALAAARGAEMAKACSLEPTGMSAVLGGDEAEVLARLEELDLTPANRNAVGQIVAAGSLAALGKLAEDPPAKARVRALATAGAFHTRYMAPAQDAYAAVAERVATSEPTTTLLSNSDGQPVASAADAMSKLIAQLTRPVRWDLCTASLRERNVTAIVEFPPAGALAGIAKRELRGTPAHVVKTPADLDGLAEL